MHGGRKRGEANEKLSILSVYRLYQVGRFLSAVAVLWIQRGGNNAFECTTIALVANNVASRLGQWTHRTQLPRARSNLNSSVALTLYVTPLLAYTLSFPHLLIYSLAYDKKLL